MMLMFKVKKEEHPICPIRK